VLVGAVIGSVDQGPTDLAIGIGESQLKLWIDRPTRIEASAAPLQLPLGNSLLIHPKINGLATQDQVRLHEKSLRCDGLVVFGIDMGEIAEPNCGS